MAEQSTKDFLFSREGRPILIGSAIAIALFGAIGYYSYSALYPSEPDSQAMTEEQRQARQAAAGSSQVRATRESSGPTNLTSDGLTPEQREALRLYNEQASAEGRLGQPTPDDVVLIPVDTDSGEDEQQEETPQQAQADQQPNLPGNQNAQPGNPNLPQMTEQERRAHARETQRQREARAAAMMREITEYRNRRMAAANEVINLYAAPPGLAGVAFGGSEGGNDKLPRAASIQRDANGQGQLDRGEGTAGAMTAGQCEVPLIKGGEIRYAQTDIALNTDFRGPVRMTFLDGNLRGYIGMGSFELNELGAKMLLRIDRLFDPDGQEYSVSGYVLDPETTLWAMSSDVNRHIIYRYGGFGLGTILSAFSKLADNRATQSEITTPEGAQSTVYRDPDGKQVTWTVLGEFSRLFEEAFRDNINRPITVTLDPEEEAGVLFENTVCELNTEITQRRNEAEQRRAQGFMDPLAPANDNRNLLGN